MFSIHDFVFVDFSNSFSVMTHMADFFFPVHCLAHVSDDYLQFCYTVIILMCVLQ